MSCRSKDNFEFIVFFGLALLIAFPDKALNLLSERTGKEYSERTQRIVTACAFGAYALACVIYLNGNPINGWLVPFGSLCGIVLMRGLISALGADEE